MEVGCKQDLPNAENEGLNTTNGLSSCTPNISGQALTGLHTCPQTSEPHYNGCLGSLNFNVAQTTCSDVVVPRFLRTEHNPLPDDNLDAYFGGITKQPNERFNMESSGAGGDVIVGQYTEEPKSKLKEYQMTDEKGLQNEQPSTSNTKLDTCDSKSSDGLDFHITLSDDDEDETDFLLQESFSLLDNETPCPLCDHVETDVDSNKANFDGFFCHLIVEHHLVIADVNLISDLRSYAIHWKNRFQQGPIEEFCSKILSNCGPKDIAKREEYFLLCDALPEDKKVREELQSIKLKQMLVRQEFERNDNNFERKCLFCVQTFHGNRLLLFNHMTTEHNFNVGHPDNIVNVREFLDLIESKMEDLQCLMCENKFKDKVSLKEHMRKKIHRKINPKNKEYDKFYIINYLEFGKNWEKIHEEPADERVEDDWSGWQEKLPCGTCFFCKESDVGVSTIYDHMQERHGFDFLRICQDMRTSFYQQVKMINFIRRRVVDLRMSSSPGKDYNQLTKEIVADVKEKVVDSANWNKPEFYFPKLEDDALLYSIDESKGLFEPEDTYVFCEDVDIHEVITNSVLTDMIATGQFNENQYPQFNYNNTPERRPLFAFPWAIKANQ